MLNVDEAIRSVLDHATPLPPRKVPLREALGCVLAENVTADLDLPPFDKALVDGFAVRATDIDPEASETVLRVGEEIHAGQTPTRPLEAGEAAIIMTGAPMPEMADAVVMVEDTERQGDRVVLRPRRRTLPGTNCLARGREMRKGEVLLGPGTKLDAVKLGLLASVGWTEPLVISRPKIAVASTGDEIVPPPQAPGPGQIRNSNATMLDALGRSSDVETEVLPIAPDDEARLKEILGRGLEADILLITGGVSAGKRDLVPGVLEALGVRAIFHKIRLKPGKPLLFGIGPERSEGRLGTLVFGLPGNPVSGCVGFLLFVGPALRVLRGGPSAPATVARYRLQKPFQHRGDRPTYHPSRLVEQNGEVVIEPLAWAGSADLRTVASADGFAIFASGDADYDEGELVEFLPLL